MFSLQQLAQQSQHLKQKLKSYKQQNPNFQPLYKKYKKLHESIKYIISEHNNPQQQKPPSSLSSNNNSNLQYSKSKQKLPQFFETLHNTTIDMRMKLLQDLKSVEKKRKIQEEQFRKQIENRDQIIQKLRDQIDQGRKKLMKNKQQGDIVNKLKQQIGKLSTQLAKQKQQNKKLTHQQQQQQKRQLSADKKLPPIPPRQSQQKQKPSLYPPPRRTSASPDNNPNPYPHDPSQSRTIQNQYILKSFSDLPQNNRNYTELDNTTSQPSQRKARSFYASNHNNNNRNGLRDADQLLRFILIQANSIEHYIQGGGNQQQQQEIEQSALI